LDLFRCFDFTEATSHAESADGTVRDPRRLPDSRTRITLDASLFYHNRAAFSVPSRAKRPENIFQKWTELFGLKWTEGFRRDEMLDGSGQ
jgi:hypothetical protein